jgi:hypothetical protein
MSFPHNEPHVTADAAVPPEVTLALVQNRAQRLAEELDRRGMPAGEAAAAVKGIADDLANVVTQLTLAVTG